MAMDPRAGSGLAGDSLLHHLNMTANVEKGGLAEYTDCTFIFGLSETVSSHVIYALQDFFQATKMGRAFNDRLKKVNKEVVIMDEFAPDTQRLPQVVVKSIPTDHVPVSLGNRLGKETFREQLFDVYGGMANMSTSIDIYESGKANVCALADVIFLSFMQYVRDRLIRINITPQPQVKFSSAAKVSGPLVGGDVYRITLVVPISSTWKQYLEIETPGVSSFESQSTPE